MNTKDAHDESTADSLLCPLLDLLGNALSHAFHKYKMFRLIFGISSILGSAHDPRSWSLHVVPIFSFVEHELLNLDMMIHDSDRLTPSVFSVNNY